jgi:hypothetical protein
MMGRLCVFACRAALWWGVAGASCFMVTVGPLPLFFDELLLGKQVVGENPAQVPDLIEFLKLRSGVVAEVADAFPDPGPVLFSTGAPSFLLPGLVRVKLIRARGSTRADDL